QLFLVLLILSTDSLIFLYLFLHTVLMHFPLSYSDGLLYLLVLLMFHDRSHVNQISIEKFADNDFLLKQFLSSSLLLIVLAMLRNDYYQIMFLRYFSSLYYLKLKIA